ncbi:MAG TPA: hypothetical protein VKX96_12050, partial [Chloroflexota bacterium]|nr:hypothetical protein [Chloroflexota bacterium]
GMDAVASGISGRLSLADEVNGAAPGGLANSPFREKVPIEGTVGQPISASMDVVNSVSTRAGADLSGVNVTIDNNPDLAGRRLYGYTSPTGQITLYPDAFSNEETLAMTLGHERNHVYQINVFGPPMDSEMSRTFERGSYAVEQTYLYYFRAHP